MSAIVDILHAGEDAIDLIKDRYPNVTISKLSDSGMHMEKYRVIIPGEVEESYYFFLCDNCIATCSRNFLSRIAGDALFKKIVKLRIASALANLQQQSHALEEEAIPVDVVEDASVKG